MTTLIEGPLPLAGGGSVAVAEHFQQAIVGPPGWLPAVGAGELVGLRIVDGAVEVAAVVAEDVTAPVQQSVRALVGRHYKNERWWVDDEPTTRITLTRALAASVLEKPNLLRTPMPPVDELLHDPLHEEHQHLFRDRSAWQLDDNVSFSIQGMPMALERELQGRAKQFGMSFDQYVIAVLGHLACRTPFAEDLEPWDGWFPTPDEQPTPPAPLRTV